MFQLSLSTDKTYPSYWDMQSSVSYLNGYTELWGTPGLKPMTNYNLMGIIYGSRNTSLVCFSRTPQIISLKPPINRLTGWH